MRLTFSRLAWPARERLLRLSAASQVVVDTLSACSVKTIGSGSTHVRAAPAPGGEVASALARRFLQLLKSALDPAGRPPSSRPTSFVWNHAGHEFILSWFFATIQKGRGLPSSLMTTCMILMAFWSAA